MCKIEVLLSCMNQKDFSIGYKTNVCSDLLIINQCNVNDYSEIMVNSFRWRMISTTERGLSKSRNMALKNAKGDILILSDDDEQFSDNYVGNVAMAFEQLPNVSVIAFNVNRINVSMKKSYYHIDKIKQADTYRSFGSPMLSFRKKDILDNQIFFNENFGSGSQWGPGEDSLFLDDIRSKNLLVYEHPFVLTTIDYSNISKWFFGFDERFFYNQGAFLAFINKKWLWRTMYYIYSSFYKLRKEKQLSPFKKIKWMRIGRKGWKKQMPFDSYIKNGRRFE